MHRLLQGDVGSGRTVVALSALLVAVQGGYQGAFMAPTEVLAEQHGLSVRHVLDGLTVPDEGTLTGDRPLRVELLTNRTGAADRNRVLAGLSDGSVDLLIGTHALLEEKEAVMADFRAGALDVLVATTVIEVGVDVPNASVMIIEDADRFGMAQLHQLRGLVGRGAAQSWCYLLGAATTPDAEQRLAAVERSTDGFELAEVDLEIRGEGTVLGTRQKGQSDLKLASLRRDKEWVARAREVAFALVDEDPTLARHDVLQEELRLLVDPQEAEFLFKS